MMRGGVPVHSADEQVLAGDAVVLGAYRVERQIGEGGFGRVYEATHLHSGLRVALKIGRRREHGERLLREARMATMLESPHAVRVLTVDHLDDGCPVIVLEFLQGTPLKDYLRHEGRVPAALAVHFALQLLEVLDEAHERGLVHRDIKPSNLFLVDEPEGSPRLKLLDFGLARAAHQATETSVTGSDVVVGSPAYMSPEQIRGDGATARSDIWAFGVVLYEMLAGERPFQGETNAAVVASIVADPPLPWKDSPQALEAGLRRVVLQCLRKNVEDRPRSAGEVARLLREALGSTEALVDDTLTVSMPLEPALGPGTKRGRLSKAPGVPALVAVLLTALVGWASWAAWSTTPRATPLPVVSAPPRNDASGGAVHPALSSTHEGPRSEPIQFALPPARRTQGAPGSPSATVGFKPTSAPRPVSSSTIGTGASTSSAGEKRFFAEPDF